MDKVTVNVQKDGSILFLVDDMVAEDLVVQRLRLLGEAWHGEEEQDVGPIDINSAKRKEKEPPKRQRDKRVLKEELGELRTYMCFCLRNIR